MLWVVALVIALPVLAWGLSRMIVHGGFAGLRWMHRKQYERWQADHTPLDLWVVDYSMSHQEVRR